MAMCMITHLQLADKLEDNALQESDSHLPEPSLGHNSSYEYDDRKKSNIIHYFFMLIVASFPVSTPSFFSHVVQHAKKSWEWRLGTRLC